ncbi:Integrase core domain-containing protein [Nitrosomonas eutropha]|nr:Integrase core domain-containing protein [Nitrosomonas eutropha]
MPPINEIKEPDLAFAGLALFIIFGLLIWYDRPIDPIESTRPFDSYASPQASPVTGHAYESWLWQGLFSFDQLCQELGIEHRLTRPRTAQTNGMVERFNGRIADVLKTHRFNSAEDEPETDGTRQRVNISTCLDNLLANFLGATN